MLQLEFSPQQKCIDLLRADTEEQVINLLRQYGYWDDPSVWRLLAIKRTTFLQSGISQPTQRQHSLRNWSIQWMPC